MLSFSRALALPASRPVGTRAAALVIVCLVVLAAAGPAVASPRLPSPRPGADGEARGSRAVVPVVTRDGSGNALARGTGFFVTIGRLLIPRSLLGGHAYSAHVLYGGREQRVTAVLAEDARAGLVLVSVDLPDGAPPALSPAPRRNGVKAGTYRALAQDGAAIPVEVGAQREIPGFGTACSLAMKGTSQPPSGSPVVDADGDLVGVVVESDAGQASLSYLLPADRLLAMTPTGPASLTDWAAQRSPNRSADGQEDFLRGMNAALRDRPDEASAHFREAASHDAGDADAQAALGASEQAAGHAPEAVAAYRRAVAADPGNAAWHHHLAVALGDAGQWDEAAREFAEVTRIRPSDADAHFNLGTAYGTLGRYQDEYNEYEAALEQNSAHVRAMRNLGIACIALKRYAEAVATFARALRLTPSDAQLHTELAVAYYDLKQYPTAIQEFRKAVELDDMDVKAHYGLAVAYAATGQRDEALSECKTLDQLDRGKADQARKLVPPVK